MAAELSEAQAPTGSAVSDGDRVARAAEALPDAPPDPAAAVGESEDPSTPSGSEDAPPAAEDSSDAPADQKAAPDPADEIEGKTVGQKHAALNARHNAAKRREKAVAEAEAKMRSREERISERERHFDTLETQLQQVPPGELLKIVAKTRNVDVNTLVRDAIKQLTGAEPEPPPEQKTKPEPDPELKARLDALEKDRQTERDRLAALEREKAKTEWIQAAASELSGDKHPLLSKLPASELSERIEDAAREYTKKVYAITEKETGRGQWLLPDREDLLEFLEEERDKELQYWEEQLKQRPSRTSPAKAASAGTGPVKTAPSARTLSNKTASERANGARPMSERERIAYAAEALQD